MNTYLDRILAAHRLAASRDGRDVDTLAARADAAPSPRGFRRHLADAERLAVIAEVKRRSPSKGDLWPDLDPAALARGYANGGASCLSVLTDVDHFGGSVADLQAARAATTLPVLRKDFTVSLNDVCDARIMGADCVLLIVAALSAPELREFASLAHELGLDVLVEVHDHTELESALAIDADLIGVNQRDLVTFEVDHRRAEQLAAAIDHEGGPGVVKVAESGVRDRADAIRLRSAGYDAVLVGESLVTAPDPVEAIALLTVE